MVVAEACLWQTKEEVEDYMEILAYLEKLREAMKEIDIDLMDEIMGKLQGFKYSSQVQKSIEKLSVFVTNLDSRQADIQIEELINQIK